MSNFGHDDYFLDKEDQLQGVLRSTAHDNWYHMLNMLDKFNEEVWDHSRKREFIRSVIANMFHFFPFSEIRNVVLKTAVSSRIVFTNIQQKSWTVIDHMLRIPDIVKHSIVSSILNGLEG